VIDDCHEFITPKLAAPETISRSRDKVGAHQNLNAVRDLTFQRGRFAMRGLPLATNNLSTKSEDYLQSL